MRKTVLIWAIPFQVQPEAIVVPGESEHRVIDHMLSITLAATDLQWIPDASFYSTVL